MSKINFKTRKSHLAKRIRIWFKEHRGEDLSFGAIIDKYCEIGMGRTLVAKLFSEMKGKDSKPLEDVITIKDTPLWEAWKAEHIQGRCDFRFHSFPGNKYHGNKGLIRKTPNLKSKIHVEYTCLKCGNNHEGESIITKPPKSIIALKAHRCPKCGEYGTCAGKFNINKEIIHKAVIANTERFVKSDGAKLIPIERTEISNG